MWIKNVSSVNEAQFEEEEEMKWLTFLWGPLDDLGRILQQIHVKIFVSV